MSAVSKEGNESVPTDEVLLAVLRSGRPLATWARMGAADRIEEYCTDAAVAEEALLRCWLATGKTVDDVPTAPANTIEEMAAHVIRFISEEQRESERLRAHIKTFVDGKGSRSFKQQVDYLAGERKRLENILFKMRAATEEQAMRDDKSPAWNTLDDGTVVAVYDDEVGQQLADISRMYYEDIQKALRLHGADVGFIAMVSGVAHAAATIATNAARRERGDYVEGSVNLLRQIEQTLAPFPDALDALEAPRHGDEIADVLVAVRAALAHPIAAALAKNPVQDDAHRVFPKSLALIEEAQAALGAVHEIVNVEDAGYHARVDALDLIGKCEGDFLDDYEWTDGDEHYHAPSTQEMGLIRDAIAGLHADEKWVEAWDAWRALVREYHANPLHGVGTAER